MSLTINTNVMSLNAQRNLVGSRNSLQTSMERLSSGLRINSAKDDAAGLAVSQQMLGQIKSLNQAVRNANDGISMIQTAEGGLQESQTMMQRMRELATQAASDTISDADRGYIALEVDALKSEIDAIANRTEFNGQSILTGSLSSTLDTANSDVDVGDVLATGVQDTYVTAIDVSNAKTDSTYTFTYAAASNELTLTEYDTTSGAATGAAQVLTLADADYATGNTSTLNFTSLGVKVTLTQSSAGASNADSTGADLATLGDIVTTNATAAAVLQIGSEAGGGGNTMNISFSDVRLTAGTDAEMAALNTSIGAFTGGGSSTRAEADDLLSKVDAALASISGERAQLGAFQNRLGHTIANLQITAENTAASRSRIVDTDFAAETANLTRTQILQQAGVSMLAQANAQPQSVLALLQ